MLISTLETSLREAREKVDELEAQVKEHEAQRKRDRAEIRNLRRELMACERELLDLFRSTGRTAPPRLVDRLVRHEEDGEEDDYQ